MFKLLSKVTYIISVLTLTFMVTGHLYAQQLDHRLGIVSVQLENNAEISELVRSLEYFDQFKTDVLIEKNVSKAFKIWNIQFNQNQINEQDFLNHIRKSKWVTKAQFDYFIESRYTFPDDPWYFLQYYHENNGQNGGTPGVDLDSELAWNTTTGGVSFFW